MERKSVRQMAGMLFDGYRHNTPYLPSILPRITLLLLSRLYQAFHQPIVSCQRSLTTNALLQAIYLLHAEGEHGSLRMMMLP